MDTEGGRTEGTEGCLARHAPENRGITSGWRGGMARLDSKDDTKGTTMGRKSWSKRLGGGPPCEKVELGRPCSETESYRLAVSSNNLKGLLLARSSDRLRSFAAHSTFKTKMDEMGRRDTTTLCRRGSRAVDKFCRGPAAMERRGRSIRTKTEIVEARRSADTTRYWMSLKLALAALGSNRCTKSNDIFG